MAGGLTDSALSVYRVLDLTNHFGYLCGKILGDLGADVIKVEPPGGDPMRLKSPFYQDDPDPNKNLYWWSYNNNKRGITLNLETAGGQQIFKRLVSKADVVIESFPPGYMASLGLGYSDLQKVNPNIIMTSITPFGQEGPYKNFKASDLTISAMSGLMGILGDDDRPPIRVGLHQSYLWGGAEAAFAIVTALFYKGVTGRGQHVDVSIQGSTLVAQGHAPLYAEMEGQDTKRMGKYVTGRSKHGAVFPAVHKCKDGHITWAIYGGPTGARTNKAMTKWMVSEGQGDEYLVNKEWDSFIMADATQEEMDRIIEPVAKFLSGLTKTEFLEEAVARGIMGYPVNTVQDILKSPQLEARDYWTEIEHPELGTTVKYPGPFSKLSETPPKVTRRAPLIGEHNGEILGQELGITDTEMILLKRKEVI